jgi:REase_MTES_1575
MAIHPIESGMLDTRVPFSRAQARAAGLTRAELLGPRFQKIFHDRYVEATVPINLRLKTETAVELAAPGAYGSHHTAASLWGGVVPASSEVHITVPRDAARTRRRGILAHRDFGKAEPVSLRGLPISSPAQTFLDLAACLGLVDLVVLGDSLVRARRLTLAALLEAASAWHGHGARKARRAAALVRDGVDSAMETRLRMLLVLAGFPEPQVNVIIRAEDGSWHLRFDLCYSAYRLIIEYDGRQHADDPRQWQRDLDRREELDAMGWRLIVVTARDLYRSPDRTLERIAEALRDRGVTPPRRLKPEWERFFPAAA